MFKIDWISQWSRLRVGRAKGSDPAGLFLFKLSDHWAAIAIVVPVFNIEQETIGL